MKTSDIGAIIDKFIESNATAIMFNGNWGIGKTYAVQQLLSEDRYKKEIYDYCNIHYISLFGFKNIEILHKELYKKFHPYKARGAKALSYISLAVSLNNASIGLNTSEIRKDIEENQMNKSLLKRDWKNVIIFDDIERVAAKEDGFIELFGYFNRIINEGIKVIAICNSNELADENKGVFDRFKEKIFDRIYTTNEDNFEVIKKIYGEKFNLLDGEAISFFENNLRFVKKSKVFIDDTLNQLSKMKGYNSTNDRLVSLICILIVKEVFTSCFSEELYQEQKKKLESSKNGDNFYASLTVNKYGTDELSTEAIERQLQQRKIYGKSSLIVGLFNYFKYYDCSYFTERPTQKSLLEKSIFYYNDEEKTIAIQEVLTSVYDGAINYDARQIYDALRDVLRYNDGILQEDDFNKLAKHISEMEESKKLELANHFEHDMYFEHSDDEAKFFKILKETLNKQEKNTILQYFKDVNVNEYDGSLIDWINKLQGRQKPLYSEISEFLNEKNFLLPDLSKTISENAWHFCHDMCSFVIKVDISLKNDLIKVLDEQLEKYPNIKCVKERVEALKKYKLKEA